MLRDVRAAEDAEGDFHVEVAYGNHDRFVGAIGVLDPFSVVFTRDTILNLEVHAGR